MFQLKPSNSSNGELKGKVWGEEEEQCELVDLKKQTQIQIVVEKFF